MRVPLAFLLLAGQLSLAEGFPLHIKTKLKYFIVIHDGDFKTEAISTIRSNSSIVSSMARRISSSEVIGSFTSLAEA